MSVLLRFASLIDRLTELFGKLATLLVTLLIFVGFYNVVARYVGRELGVKLATNTIIEGQWYLFSVIFLLGFGYILKHNVNVRVDFLYSKWDARRRALVDFVGTLFFLIPFCLLGLYISWRPVLSSWGRLPNGTWGRWELSPDPGGLPRAPIKTMLIVGLLLLLLQAIAQLIKYAAVLTGHVRPEVVKEIETYQAPSYE